MAVLPKTLSFVAAGFVAGLVGTVAGAQEGGTHTHEDGSVHQSASAADSQPVAAPLPPIGETTVVVEVVKVGPAGRAPAGGAKVSLKAVNESGAQVGTWSAVAGDDGLARFEAVPVHPRTAVVASSDDKGIHHESQRFVIKPGEEGRALVEVYEPSNDDTKLRVQRVSTELFLWEGSVHIRQSWTFINGGDTTFDAKLGSRKTGEKGLLIWLPEGASAVHGAELGPDQFEAAGAKFLYRGVVRPGGQSPTTVQLSFLLDYESPELEIAQGSEYPIDDVLAIIPERPSVRGRNVAGVRMTVGAHNLKGFELKQTDSGLSFWVGRGLAVAGGNELRFAISGLPIRSQTGNKLAVAGAVLAMLWGLARMRGRQAAGGPGAPVPVGPIADPAAVAELRRRRERLFAKLLELDGQASAGGADGHAGSDAQNERAAIKRSLIDIDRRLQG